MATNPLRWLVNDWLAVIEDAKKQKHERFGQYAEECERFYDSAHNWMWKHDYAKGPQGFLESGGEVPYPTFQMTANRVFEAVAIFGPSMMQRYPQVTVTPVAKPMIAPELLGVMQDAPEYQQVVAEQEQGNQLTKITAGLCEHYLNWLQVEVDKKRHARRSITESLVSGLGLVLTELYAPPGGTLRYPRSRHISWRQLIKDQDARYDEDVQWIAIEWTSPVNLVEERFGLVPGSIKGQLQSTKAQNSTRGGKEAKSGQLGGDSFDLLKWYEIYSKNGAGDKLKRSKSDWDLSSLGRYTYLALAKGIPYPLNLPEERLTDPEAVKEAVQWPTGPFWLDNASGSGWPTTELSYYDKSGSVWPVSLFKPCIGPMRFVNWCMSFLADKVAANAHEYIGVMKAAAKDIKEQLLAQRGPIKLLEISDLMGQNINQVITRLEHGQVDIEIYRMVESQMQAIDKSTGLTELVYGLTSSQMRSATEAGVRNDRISVRPDDMAEKTDDWYSYTAAKEMIAAVTHLEVADVQGPLGELGAQVFEKYVLSQHPEVIVRDFQYRVAAGSARKPNKTMILQGLNDFGRVAMPVLQQLVAMGMPQPFNEYMLDVAKALDLPEPERYLVQLPPPQEQGPSPEEQEAQREQEKHEQQVAQADEKHQQAMEQDQMRAMMDALGMRQKLAFQQASDEEKIKAAKAQRAAKAKSNGS